MVASQAKTWIAAGIAIVMLAAAKKVIVSSRQPDREHVVDPDAEADERAAAAWPGSTSVLATSGRCEKTGMIVETIPTAGRKMM